MTQEYDTTTERGSGFQGLGGGAYQQAFCNSARIALLATISYPFTLPAVSPCTKNFWQRMKISTTGISVSTDMANT